MEFKSQFNKLLVFIKNPAPYSVNLSVNEKVKNTLCYFFVYVIIGDIFSLILTEILNYFKLYEIEFKEEMLILKYSILSRYLLIALIAPFIEEMIFRYPLKYFQNRRFYKYYVYSSALLFGLIHFSNYTSSSNAVYFILFYL